MDHKFEWQEQRTTTPDGVYRTLRAAILDGSVPPGGQLREAHIATDLGISRSPLREALTKLEEEGLATGRRAREVGHGRPGRRHRRVPPGTGRPLSHGAGSPDGRTGGTPAPARLRPCRRA
ncbi:GntR family transcriptional regulator [Streptomyces griseus]|uniref:GntR family transcriptional regulator n=1 Tax=Streptomyces griseus TaxID=1911 RepID=UPI001F21A27E|nr:GntR family transcriptional regulator [Streptomyces griseus]